MQVVPKGEGSITPDGKINGYVNETVIQPDGSYKLLFSLTGLYETGREYECHIDLAGKGFLHIPGHSARGAAKLQHHRPLPDIAQNNARGGIFRQIYFKIIF